MKHKLALLNEVLARQAAAFAELQAANRCVWGGGLGCAHAIKGHVQSCSGREEFTGG